MMESAVIISLSGEPLYWHLPEGRTAGSIPDSRKLWDFVWENRNNILGIAHTHPGSGTPFPSWEDVTTFEGFELGLGTKLMWWIFTKDQGALFIKSGKKYNYAKTSLSKEIDEISWVQELRKYSY